jgi:ferric-dicitrate binding protein FerR (iron transport regulator)
VYLNAASSLKYPTRFTGNEREVTLTGEGYFEIAKNAKQPFIVVTTNQSIRVLGTHFNVSCYPGDPIKTTLAEGKIEISRPANSQKTTLKPGDQSIVSPEGIEVHQVNPDDVIAWKDGKFVFIRTPLKEMLRQISRWYDIDVDYSQIPDQNFDGEISRKLSLQEVLKSVEAGTDLHFQIEGRRIVRK